MRAIQQRVLGISIGAVKVRDRARGSKGYIPLVNGQPVAGRLERSKSGALDHARKLVLRAQATRTVRGMLRQDVKGFVREHF